MNDCIFCKIIKGEIPCYKVYEDDEFLAFLDIQPINFGHTLVIPKEHYETFEKTPFEILEKLIVLTQKLAKVIKKAMSADGFNIGINNEKVAGQLVLHMHIHIIPRFSDDGLDPWKDKKCSEDQMKKILEKIKIEFE